MMGPRYIADGVYEDVTKLLTEFTEKNSIEFSDFTAVWKNNHFSLIFMGRPDHIETSEFTNEVYRISTHFLSSSSIYQKIGAVYLLYALYRNQIADPPIKVRIELNQWRIVNALRIEAILKQYRTLQYVIDYLIKNAFLYAAHNTVKGPLIGSMQKLSKSHEIVSNLMSCYNSALLQYSESNNLQALRDLHNQYLSLKKNIKNEAKVSLNADSKVYEKLIGELENIVNSKKSTKDESIRSRRAKIKAESFLRKTNSYANEQVEDAISETDADFKSGAVKKKKTVRNRRLPAHKRRVGRPSKKPKHEESVEESSDDNVDISHLLNQQHDFYLPPDEEGKKLKSKPGRFYYKLSPKHEDDSSSDPDNPLMTAQ